MNLNSNRTSYTDFEFKQKFYSNKYLLQSWIVQIHALTIHIHFWLHHDYITNIFTLITSLHITHTRILSSTAFRFESSIWVICKNILKRSKIEREIFLKFERNDDFENIVCLSYLGCSSSFLTVQYLCISVFFIRDR